MTGACSRYFLSEQFLGIILLYEQSDCIEKRWVKIIQVIHHNGISQLSLIE
jgi:hypothetical protein